jgi:hypothetical protein
LRIFHIKKLMSVCSCLLHYGLISTSIHTSIQIAPRTCDRFRPKLLFDAFGSSNTSNDRRFTATLDDDRLIFG